MILQSPIETAYDEFHVLIEMLKANGITQGSRNPHDYARAKELLSMIVEDPTEYDRGISYICGYLGL